MGYEVEASINVTIPAEKVKGALAALKEMMLSVKGNGSGGRWEGGIQKEAWFSWVGTKEVLDAVESNDLVAALGAWRYDSSSQERSELEKLAQPDETVYDDIIVDWFAGSKWGDDEKLWKVLAPFVEEGSSIVWRGEDGNNWRYLFEGGQMKEQVGEIVWRDE